MSTTGGSEQGTVYVTEEPASVIKKFKRAVTDSEDPPTIRRSPDKPGITNLIEILASVRGVDPAAIEADFADARYGDFKVAVAGEVAEWLTPVRERYEALRSDEAELERILAEGAAKAHAIASETLRDVRRVMGVGRP
jgi:tryptophanyl-tRNA synthetase